MKLIFIIFLILLVVFVSFTITSILFKGELSFGLIFDYYEYDNYHKIAIINIIISLSIVL